jgi:hypothetical protein
VANDVHDPRRMNYVMEVGPLADGVWVVFSVDDSGEPHVELSAGTDRDGVRNELASLIHGRPARCCSSLRAFGKPHGWIAAPPHRLAREVAAWAAVCGENMLMLAGMLPDPRLIDAWLRACSSYVAAKPWERLRGVRQRVIDVHFDGSVQGRRTVGVFGNERKQRIVIAESLEVLLDESGPLGVPGDCLSQVLYSEPGATSEAIAGIHERTFVPRLIGVRGGQLTPLSEGELLLLTGVTSALASLCAHRSFGRSEMLGLETLALPLELEPSRHRLAS